MSDFELSTTVGPERPVPLSLKPLTFFTFLYKSVSYLQIVAGKPNKVEQRLEIVSERTYQVIEEL